MTRIENEKTKGLRDGSGRRVGTDHWLTIDAGFNVLLDHVSVDWYFPALVANRAAEEPTAQFRLAGPLCDGGDVVPGEPGTPYRLLPAGTTVGDLVALLNVGAYTLETMFPYNARPRAAAYAVTGDEVIQIRDQDSFGDMVAHDWPLPPAPGDKAESGKASSRRPGR